MHVMHALATAGLLRVANKVNICIDDSGATGNGKPVQIWSCSSDHANQSWGVRAYNGASQIYMTKKKDMCLDIPKSASGTIFQTWTCYPLGNGNEINQMFDIISPSASGSIITL